MIERFNGRRPPPGRQLRAAMSDFGCTTAFSTLRQQPLPSLAERRRLAREMLDHQQAEVARLARVEPAGEAIRATLDNVEMLRKAIDYLGEPNMVLDVYRTFCLPLPRPRFTPLTDWEPLPLDKPRGKGERRNDLR